MTPEFNKNKWLAIYKVYHHSTPYEEEERHIVVHSQFIPATMSDWIRVALASRVHRRLLKTLPLGPNETLSNITWLDDRPVDHGFHAKHRNLA